MRAKVRAGINHILINCSIGLIVLLFIFAALALPIGLGAIQIERQSVEAQIKRTAELEQSYLSGTATKVNEQDFCEFDVADANTIPLNEFVYMATHNSYKKYQDIPNQILAAFGTTLNKSYNFGDMDYQHENPTDQLNRGIRGMEWDIAKTTGPFNGYMVQHENYLDPDSWVIDFELGLKELLMWSNYNPGHMPVTIMLELKQHHLLGTTKQNITDADFNDLQNTIYSVMGDKMVDAVNVLNGYASLEDMRNANDYPMLSEFQDKFIFVVYPSKFNYKYYDNFETSDQKLFFASSKDFECAESIFYVDNKPSDFTTQKVNQGYIVRTRMDEVRVVNEDRYLDAINSGAQILTSDHIESIYPIYDDYTAYLDVNNKKITMKRS